jgi:hypothetical protein
MESNNNNLSRVVAILTLTLCFLFLNVSGALGAFWRTLDNITSNGITYPASYIYGYGYGSSGWGYGTGYGYGYGTFAA